MLMGLGLIQQAREVIAKEADNCLKFGIGDSWWHFDAIFDLAIYLQNCNNGIFFKQCRVNCWPTCESYRWLVTQE